MRPSSEPFTGARCWPVREAIGGGTSGHVPSSFECRDAWGAPTRDGSERDSPPRPEFTRSATRTPCRCGTVAPWPIPRGSASWPGFTSDDATRRRRRGRHRFGPQWAGGGEPARRCGLGGRGPRGRRSAGRRGPHRGGHRSWLRQRPVQQLLSARCRLAGDAPPARWSSTASGGCMPPTPSPTRHRMVRPRCCLATSIAPPPASMTSRRVMVLPGEGSTRAGRRSRSRPSQPCSRPSHRSWPVLASPRGSGRRACWSWAGWPPNPCADSGRRPSEAPAVDCCWPATPCTLTSPLRRPAAPRSGGSSPPWASRSAFPSRRVEPDASRLRSSLDSAVAAGEWSPVVGWRHVDVERGRAVGVRGAGGASVRARRAVLADVGAPQLYLSLLDRSAVPSRTLADIRRFQYDAGTVKVDWALRSPIPWIDPVVGQAGTVHVVGLGRPVVSLRLRAGHRAGPVGALPAARPDDHHRSHPVTSGHRVGMGVHPRTRRRRGATPAGRGSTARGTGSRPSTSWLVSRRGSSGWRRASGIASSPATC